MSEDIINNINEEVDKHSIHTDLVEALQNGQKRKYVRFVVAALSSLPWVGGVMSAASSLSAEQDQDKINILQKLWVEEHKQKIIEFGETLNNIFIRLDGFGEEIKERIESPEYVTLVKKTFLCWDHADTQEKKLMLKKLITNAGAISLCPDDLIRLFISWIDFYHEAHFAIIRAIYQNPRITRGAIWDEIHSERPREDSAEADLFRYLIRDLSTGGVIRQEKDVNIHGQFIKKSKKGQQKGITSSTVESSFEDTKPYVLTELGKEFVHYVMEDVVIQIAN